MYLCTSRSGVTIKNHYYIFIRRIKSYQMRAILLIFLIIICSQVSATDADDGRNGAVSYALYEGNSTQTIQLFALNPITGDITLRESALYKGEPPPTGDITLRESALYKGETPHPPHGIHRPQGVNAV